MCAAIQEIVRISFLFEAAFSLSWTKKKVFLYIYFASKHGNFTRQSVTPVLDWFLFYNIRYAYLFFLFYTLNGPLSALQNCACWLLVLLASGVTVKASVGIQKLLIEL